MVVSQRMVQLVLIVAFLSRAAWSAGCPSGCTCLPDLSSVECDSVDRIPQMDYSNTYELDLSNNIFSSPVLQRLNLTGMNNIESLRLKGCGLNTIEYHTFNGKSLPLVPPETQTSFVMSVLLLAELHRHSPAVASTSWVDDIMPSLFAD